MHLIDSDGATVDNRFTEGDASLSIPATVVSDDIANAWQLEIANLIVQGANIALLTSGTDTYEQLLAAVQEMIKKGGSLDPVSQTINNNVASATDVTGIVFDKTVTKSVKMNFDIHRRTDTQHVNEKGELFMLYDPEDDDWKINLNSHFDDAGVSFSVTAAGQLQYTSDDLTGATYSGILRISHIQRTDFDVTPLPAP